VSRGRPPRLLAVGDPDAAGLDGVAPGDAGAGGPLTVRVTSTDPATALAELAWAISVGADTVIVPDLEAARDYLTVDDALHGRTDVDPMLALADELRREPPSTD
jgi:citrate lyase beta subunit